MDWSLVPEISWVILTVGFVVIAAIIVFVVLIVGVVFFNFHSKFIERLKKLFDMKKLNGRKPPPPT